MGVHLRWIRRLTPIYLMYFPAHILSELLRLFCNAFGNRALKRHVCPSQAAVPVEVSVSRSPSSCGAGQYPMLIWGLLLPPVTLQQLKISQGADGWEGMGKLWPSQAAPPVHPWLTHGPGKPWPLCANGSGQTWKNPTQTNPLCSFPFYFPPDPQMSPPQCCQPRKVDPRGFKS